jgi:hypothetical protein
MFGGIETTMQKQHFSHRYYCGIWLKRGHGAQ